MEKSWIPFLRTCYTFDWISNLIIECIEHWQTILSLESIHQILRRLVEIPTTRPHTPTTIQHIAPISTTKSCVIIGIIRTLNCKYRFLAILIFRQEDVAEIFQVTILGILYYFCVFNNFLHISFIQESLTIGSFITITPSQSQIALSQIRCYSHLMYTASIRLVFRKN